MNRMTLLEPTDSNGNMKETAAIAVFGVLFGNAPYFSGITFDRVEILLYHALLVTIAYLSFRKNRKKK